jgi:hypothetical protein
MLVTDRRKSDGHVRCLESQMHSRWVEWHTGPGSPYRICFLRLMRLLELLRERG